MKKLAGFLLVFILIGGLFATAAAAYSVCTTCETIDDQFACEICTMNYDLAHGHIHQLIVLMGGDPTVDDWAQTFPEFYGGIKFNDQGNLVVGININADDLHTPLYDAVREFFNERDIIVAYTQYSSNETAAVMDYMTAHFLADERPEVFDYMTGFGLGFARIQVWFYEGNQAQYEMDELIALFRETISDADMFEFEWGGAFRSWEDVQPYYLAAQSYPQHLCVVLLIALAVAVASIAVSLVTLLRRKKA